MVGSRGFRRKTRSTLKKRPHEHGKLGLSRLLYEYKAGDRVVIKIDSGVHKGMPHRRFNGHIGTIVDKKGRAYVIYVTQGNDIKEIIVRPEHLKPYAEG